MSEEKITIGWEKEPCKSCRQCDAQGMRLFEACPNYPEDYYPASGQEKINFTCEKCGKTSAIPKDIYEKKYKNQANCLSCR